MGCRWSQPRCGLRDTRPSAAQMGPWRLPPHPSRRRKLWAAEGRGVGHRPASAELQARA